MRKQLSLALLCTFFAFACNETHEGTDDAGVEVDAAIRCEPCEDAIQLRIQGVSNPDDIVVEGAEVTCMDTGDLIYCGIRDIPPGEYSLTVSAPGMIPETFFFSIGEPFTDDAGCTCPSTFSRLITLRPSP